MILINIDNGNVINASKFSERYTEKLLSTKKFIKESDKFEVSTEQGVEILEQERIRLVEWEEKLMNKENELNELAKSSYHLGTFPRCVRTLGKRTQMV